MSTRITEPGARKSSHAGLELVREDAILRRAVGSGFPATDFGAVPMILVLLGLILVGGRRILLRHEQGDPVGASPAFQAAGAADGERLDATHPQRGPEARGAGRERLAADRRSPAHPRRRFVVSTGLKVGAFRGYNPHRRKAPSYYPVTACEAQEGQIVRLRNRPGNIHDGKAAVGFIET